VILLKEANIQILKQHYRNPFEDSSGGYGTDDDGIFIDDDEISIDDDEISIDDDDCDDDDEDDYDNMKLYLFFKYGLDLCNDK
jgi:hypothetical protein